MLPDAYIFIVRRIRALPEVSRNLVHDHSQYQL